MGFKFESIILLFLLALPTFSFGEANEAPSEDFAQLAKSFLTANQSLAKTWKEEQTRSDGSPNLERIELAMRNSLDQWEAILDLIEEKEGQAKFAEALDKLCLVLATLGVTGTFLGAVGTATLKSVGWAKFAIGSVVVVVVSVSVSAFSMHRARRLREEIAMHMKNTQVMFTNICKIYDWMTINKNNKGLRDDYPDAAQACDEIRQLTFEIEVEVVPAS